MWCGISFSTLKAERTKTQSRLRLTVRVVRFVLGNFLGPLSMLSLLHPLFLSSISYPSPSSVSSSSLTLSLLPVIAGKNPDQTLYYLLTDPAHHPYLCLFFVFKYSFCVNSSGFSVMVGSGYCAKIFRMWGG